MPQSTHGNDDAAVIRQPVRQSLLRSAWWQILGRAWRSSQRHQTGFLAAGVAFFAFLSLAPGLALLVMAYGLVAEPATILDNLLHLIRLMPPLAARVIVEQLSSLIRAAAATHGIAMVPAVPLSLYAAAGGARGVITSLNMIHDCRERRGMIHLTVVALGIAAAGVCVALLGLAIASATAYLRHAWPELGPTGAIVANGVVGLAGTLLTALVIALIYRFAPCHARPRWRWLTLGTAAATALWLAGSILFGWYVRMASYDATYGSLATVVALIMWIYVSAHALLLGAILEAEIGREMASANDPAHPGTAAPHRRHGNFPD